jgi:hypothetical protein
MHPMFAQLFLETDEDELAYEEDKRRRSRRTRRQALVKTSGAGSRLPASPGSGGASGSGSGRRA